MSENTVDTQVKKLRSDSEKIEAKIDSHINNIDTLNEQFSEIFDTKEDSVALYDEVKKDNPELFKEQTHNATMISRIESYGLKDSKAYANALEAEKELNGKISALIREKYKELDKKLELIGFSIYELKESYYKDLEEFKKLSKNIEYTHNPEKAKEDAQQRALRRAKELAEIKRVEQELEKNKKPAVLSTMEMLFATVNGHGSHDENNESSEHVKDGEHIEISEHQEVSDSNNSGDSDNSGNKNSNKKNKSTKQSEKPKDIFDSLTEEELNNLFDDDDDF